MSANHFFHFGTGTGKLNKLSQCSVQEQEIQETIPVAWEGNTKYKNPSRCSGRGQENKNFIPFKRDGNGKFLNALNSIFQDYFTT